MDTEVKRQHALERAKTQEEERTNEEWARILLNECADYLENGHWIRGAMSDHRMNYCAVGAIDNLYRKNKKYPRRIQLPHVARELLASVITTGRYGSKKDFTGKIITFNDSSRDGGKRVVAAFRKAAKVGKTD